MNDMRQAELSLGVRFCLLKPTCAIPNRLPMPALRSKLSILLHRKIPWPAHPRPGLASRTAAFAPPPARGMATTAPRIVESPFMAWAFTSDW
jgi:hypothetical protein